MANKQDNKKGGAKGGAKGGKGGAKAGKSPAKSTPPKASTKSSTKAASSRGTERKQLIPTEHAGAGLPVPAPRLREHYKTTVRPRLTKQFGFGNIHEVPTVEKIVINCGVGEAIRNSKILDVVVDELALITGQRPVRRKAKKSIANFGQREGQEIGASVTLRGPRMWEFMDRLVSVAIPRIRDFRGLNTRAFDGRGNYTMGVKEQMIFPEISYDMVDEIHGMDITFVTTTNKDDQALSLLRELGMPFRGEEKPVIVHG
jgi:large subunit ribosomal protein L5